MSSHELTFPLVPRGRLLGLAFGAMYSSRRGMGFDVAGSRPYRPGDSVHRIDWNASARLSSARGSDEFIVREHYAEEAPRVVLVCDRRPEMALFPPTLPWLSKPDAMLAAGRMIAESAMAARGFVGYLDYANVANPSPELRSDEPFWRPPHSQAEARLVTESHLLHPAFHAPEDNLTRALDYLAELRRAVPAGSFVFVLSDFLVTPGDESWLRAREHRWDVVPVVIQDPVWEQSFPPIGSVVVPFADPRTGRVRHTRLTDSEADERRRANEERLESLLTRFRRLGLEPILLSSSERSEVLRAFLVWSEQRLLRASRAW